MPILIEAGEALLASAQTVRRFGLESSAISDDDIETAIASASAAVQTYCGRRFTADTWRETIHVSAAATVLLLDKAPVLSITAVATEAGALLPDEYELEPEVGMLYRMASGQRRVWRPGRVSIDYRAGFDAVPADVMRAIIVMARDMVLSAERDPSVKSEQTEGLSTRTYFGAAAVSPEASALLAPWRVPVFA